MNIPKTKHVLIVEHEGLLVGVLKHAFTSLNTEEYSFKLNIASSCSDALNIIDTHQSIDIAIININIPPYNNGNVLFIEDISLKIRFTFPKVKIIVLSSYKSNSYLNSLLKTLNPECLLIKSDINFDEFLQAIKTVVAESPYYSKTVLKYIRKRITNTIDIDRIDKTLLHYLSNGTKMKDLPKFINLSKSAIELRKRRLKEEFNVDGKDDYHLLNRAEELGFI